MHLKGTVRAGAHSSIGRPNIMAINVVVGIRETTIKVLKRY
jgi:hypothetical protein